MKERLIVAAAALLLAGCGNMKKQSYFRPEVPAPLLPRGTSAQLPPPHTVARGLRLPDDPFVTGVKDGKLLERIPVAVTAALVARGRDRYEIYCVVCHGPGGDGDGVIVRRGFPAPPSYHLQRLVEAPAGHFFQVMTTGFGAMYPYADRVAPADRWAIVAYIRALQLSRRADARLLTAAERGRMEAR
ncbi:MAG TPA: cytochrome c [Opitutaceae bacterium]|jgi:mono/diheme cytochrome c family protein|nr:cytochrome c [Opitutaceae bacterium]